MSKASKPLLTSQFVASVLGLPHSGLETLFANVTTDSRKITLGSLFVAIQGETFDGNEFVQQATDAGATGVICRPDAVLNQKVGPTYFVPDTLEAYRKLAGAWRKQFSIPILAVAGSVGKTSTKEILSAVIQGKYSKILKTRGSQNGFVGIAMTLLELNEQTQAAVIEVGIDEPGAMIQHLKLVSPTASVLTPIGPEHLEKLIDLKTVAAEEGIALTYVAEHGGFVAINLDDPWIRPYYDQIQSKKKIGFSLETEFRPGAGFHAKISKDASVLEIENEHYPLPLPGRHNALNLLAAVAVAQSVAITPDEIRLGLKKFQGAEGRSELKKLKNGAEILCDYYNANPTSTEAAFELLTQLARGNHMARTRFAVLGDMLELGVGEEGFHRGLAGSIIRLGLENIYLLGKRMKWLEDELKKNHYRGNCLHFSTHDEIFAKLRSHMTAESALLIKGSHSMKMEEIWKKFASSDL